MRNKHDGKIWVPPVLGALLPQRFVTAEMAITQLTNAGMIAHATMAWEEAEPIIAEINRIIDQLKEMASDSLRLHRTGRYGL